MLIIADNSVADCAFSAIRANSCGNLQVTGNTCLRSGETAIYAEFTFEGAVITGNIVDGAANGISVVNFNEGGRLAVVHRQPRAQPRDRSAPTPPTRPASASASRWRPTRPSPAMSSRTRRSTACNLGWGPFLRNVTATGNVIRNAGDRHRGQRRRGVGLGRHRRQCHRRRAGAARSSGYRWSDAVTGDLVARRRSASRI